jgi:uncharacterized protein HemX
VALPLLTPQDMPEPEEPAEHHMERRVVYETVSSSSSKTTAVTYVLVAVIAIALIVWVVMQMR